MAKPILTLPCKYGLSDFEKTGELHYCKACDHSLKDFRNSTEAEIQLVLSATNGKSCGIFHSDQLAHQKSTFQLGIQRRVGLSLLGILGFISPAVMTSCEVAAPAPEPKKDVSKEDEAFAKLKFPMIVSGYLKDQQTNDPLGMSEISICQQNTIIRTVHTDKDGFFTIKLEKNDLSSANFDLILEQLSYKPDTIREVGHLAKEDRAHLVLSLEAYPKPVIVEGSGGEYAYITFTTMTLGGVSAPDYPDYQAVAYPYADDLSRLVKQSRAEGITNPDQTNPAN